MHKNRSKWWIRSLIALLLAPLVVVSARTPVGVGAAVVSSGWRLVELRFSIRRAINSSSRESTGTDLRRPDFVAHGLYSKDYPYIIDEIKANGYNTIRIPFSNEMWEKDPNPEREHR